MWSTRHHTGDRDTTSASAAAGLGHPGSSKDTGRQSGSCRAQLDLMLPWPRHHRPIVSPAWPSDPTAAPEEQPQGDPGDRAGSGALVTMVAMVVIAKGPAAMSLPWWGWKTWRVPKTQVEFCVSESLKSRVSGRSCWGLFFSFFSFLKRLLTFIQSLKTAGAVGALGGVRAPPPSTSAHLQIEIRKIITKSGGSNYRYRYIDICSLFSNI